MHIAGKVKLANVDESGMYEKLLVMFMVSEIPSPKSESGVPYLGPKDARIVRMQVRVGGAKGLACT